MVLPFVDVSHLPSSTSFYSTVLQPLGLRYLSADREPPACIGTVTFGIKASSNDRDSIPVLQIREAAHPLEPLRLSSLVFTAPSHAAVTDFHAAGLDANPWLRIQNNADGSSAYSGPNTWPRPGVDGGVSRALIRDLDGNTMEAIYPGPSPKSYPPLHNGVPVRKTQSTRDEAARILDWNYDVASKAIRSGSNHSSASSHHSQALVHASSQSQRTRLVPHHAPSYAPPAASIVSASMSQHAHSRHSDESDRLVEDSISPRQSPSKSGLNTTNVVGAILGVAAGAVAGAALTYSMVNKERERRPQQNFEPPHLARRATYPEKLPSSHSTRDRRQAYDDYPPKALPYADDYEYGPPLISYPEQYPLQSYPFQEEYVPRKTPYGDDLAPRRMPFRGEYPPEPRRFEDENESDDEAAALYRSERSRRGSSATKSASKTRRSSTKSADQSRFREAVEEEEEAYERKERSERRSRLSSRHSSRAPTTRSRSEANASRALMITDSDNRSHAGSRHHASPASMQLQSHSRRSRHDPERDSYFSAKSQRSSATVRYPPAPEVEEVVTRSRAGSRVATTKISVSGHPITIREHSKAPSRVSARNIELPVSGVGSSNANWDDDIESVAPSDSISCVGSKMSRRSRRTRA